MTLHKKFPEQGTGSGECKLIFRTDHGGRPGGITYDKECSPLLPGASFSGKESQRNL